MGLVSRIACIHAPDLPQQASLRAALESPVQPTQAALGSAEGALVDLAWSFSPLVEPCGKGEVLLEVGDLGLLYASEQALAEAMQKGAARLGLQVQIAITKGARSAQVLARSLTAGTVLVLDGSEERTRLAPLPIEVLPISVDQVVRFRRFGIRTLGDLAALPKKGLAQRFGAETLLFHSLASGEDQTRLRPLLKSEPLTEAHEFLDPVDNLEPLFFVLRGLLSRLLCRLELRSLGCQQYTLQMQLCPLVAGGQPLQERNYVLTQPTRDVSTLLELSRIDLNSNPPPHPVALLRVLTEPRVVRPTQLGLFEEARPLPEKLSTTMARLSALFGKDRVGSPAVVDSYLEDQVHLVDFPAGELRPAKTLETIHKKRPLAHVLRPPMPAEVLLSQGDQVPMAIRSDLGAMRILRHAGPFRVRIGFGRPVLRDYYDIETESGVLLRIFQDQASGGFFIEAQYD